MSPYFLSQAVTFSFQYRGRSWEGCNIAVTVRGAKVIEVSIPRTVVGGLQCKNVADQSLATKFQYRGRSWEGCNTVPLSPWGYWPQMSKMENLCDFPAFSSLRQQALFAFCSVTISETLALQGFAVFGKKLENLRPF